MNNSLASRVARVIAGGMHAIVDRIEDLAPIHVLEQSTRELEEVTDEVRSELGQAIANRHLLQQQHLKLNSEHEALHDSIVVALGSGKEDLAKHGVARQIDIEAQLPVLELSLAESVSREQQLSGFVDALLGKKREMQSAIHDLQEATQRANQVPAANRITSNRIEGKVQNIQDSFDRSYQRQATGIGGASGLSIQETANLNELSDLVRERKINDRLAQIKAN
jgi:phage shock protein A